MKLNERDYDILISCGFKWQSLDILHKNFFKNTVEVSVNWSNLTLGPNVFLYKYKDSDNHCIIRKKISNREMYF